MAIIYVILEEWKPEVILAVGGFGNEYTSEMVPAAKGCALPNLTEKTTGNALVTHIDRNGEKIVSMIFLTSLVRK